MFNHFAKTNELRWYACWIPSTFPPAYLSLHEGWGRDNFSKIGLVWEVGQDFILEIGGKELIGGEEGMGFKMGGGFMISLIYFLLCKVSSNFFFFFNETYTSIKLPKQSKYYKFIFFMNKWNQKILTRFNRLLEWMCKTILLNRYLYFEVIACRWSVIMVLLKKRFIFFIF